MDFELSSEKILASALAAGLPGAGAVVTFEGLVRDNNEGQKVLSLEYMSYLELAQKEGQRVIAEAKQRFPLLAARAVHRVGHLQVGDAAVWIGVASGHRGEAFEACRWIIDEIKARVPIWKKEHYASGSSEWLQVTK